MTDLVKTMHIVNDAVEFPAFDAVKKFSPGDKVTVTLKGGGGETGDWKIKKFGNKAVFKKMTKEGGAWINWPDDKRDVGNGIIVNLDRLSPRK